MRSPTAVYTTLAPERVLEVDRGDEPSEPLFEKKRWVGAAKAFQEAEAQGEVYPLLLSDARNCADLVYWARVREIRLTEEGTWFRFSHLHGLEDCFTQDLVLPKEGRNIAPGFIRPYALVRTPPFLDEASVDAEARCRAQTQKFARDADWDNAAELQTLDVEVDEERHLFVDADGDISWLPAVRRRGDVAKKLLRLGLRAAPGHVLGLGEDEEEGTVYVCQAQRYVTPEREATAAKTAARPAPTRVAPTRAETPTLFTWGYYGWGSALPQWLALTEAAERARGFAPPVFVDVRYRRSVRAAGFRDRAFEQAVPEGRHHWLRGLGNEAIGEGGEMRLADPAEVATLLDLALDAHPRRRVIFFCACREVHHCHRALVRRKLLAEAKRRGVRVAVTEWPGGDPVGAPPEAVPVPPRELDQVLRGAPRIAVPEALALGPLAALPYGGLVALTDGARSVVASVGAVTFSAGHWFVEPFVQPIEEGDEAEALLELATKFRADRELGVFES